MTFALCYWLVFSALVVMTIIKHWKANTPWPHLLADIFTLFLLGLLGYARYGEPIKGSP